MNGAALIRELVEPMKEAAMDYAEKAAIKKLESAWAHLEAGSWDLRIAASRPKATASRAEYVIAASWSELLSSVTTWVQSNVSMNGPCPVRWDNKKAKKYIADQRERAGAQYEVFIEKLTKKICSDPTVKITHASIYGHHIWGYSILTVHKRPLVGPDSPVNEEIEYWKTHQIANYSKYHRYFPQWPTRKIQKP